MTREWIHLKLLDLESFDQEERLRWNCLQTVLEVHKFALPDRPVKGADMAAETFGDVLLLLEHVDEVAGLANL